MDDYQKRILRIPCIGENMPAIIPLVTSTYGPDKFHMVRRKTSCFRQFFCCFINLKKKVNFLLLHFQQEDLARAAGDNPTDARVVPDVLRGSNNQAKSAYEDANVSSADSFGPIGGGIFGICSHNMLEREPQQTKEKNRIRVANKADSIVGSHFSQIAHRKVIVSSYTETDS